ncbi:hypothetical protein R50072_36950 [Simiduia litorea]|uniref:hypothetical protein n=1 Tax=Simiduia litorea TaxID=1435348 RepID=UPI0036F29414
MKNIADCLLTIMGYLDILEAEELDEDTIVDIQEGIASEFESFSDEEKSALKEQAQHCYEEAIKNHSPKSWADFYKNFAQNYGLE